MSQKSLRMDLKKDCHRLLYKPIFTISYTETCTITEYTFASQLNISLTLDG